MRIRAEAGMVGGWMARRAAARSAIAGLAVGLVMLAALTMWATIVTQRTTGHVRQIDQVSEAWIDVFTRLTAEDAALREYLATADQDFARQNLIDVVGSAGGRLDWLQRHGGSGESKHLSYVQLLYAHYTEVVRSVLGEGDINELVSYSVKETLSFTPLHNQVAWNIERKQQELTRYLVEIDNQTTTLRWIASAVIAIDGVLLVISSMVLIGYQRRAERESASNRYKALHDSLTGLANRQMLAERAEAAVEDARLRHGAVGLLLIDLDRFKDVNDTLGHHYGDRVLQRVASRLTSVSRQSDMVARLGGDEFAVLLTHVSSPEDISKVAERIRRTIHEPVVLDGLTVGFGASIGAAVYPEDSRDPEELLKHADVAMYVAKRAGIGVSLYNPGKDERDPATLPVLSELRRGIERGELVLHYQPKVDTVTLRPIGVEALVRWQHPERGLLPPVAFPPLIEPTEFVELLTDTVLEMAIKQAHVWESEGRRLPIAVNITARSLLNAEFPERVAQLLHRFGVSPELLTLELTESALITAPAVAAEALRQLRAFGIQASIDDFGTGYSSLVFLRDMPIHELKIDRSFVTNMRSDERNHAIVKAMVDLAHNLALDVVAEGVEDAETLDTLAHLGCGSIQGYFVSRPLPVSELNAWLDRHVHFAQVA